MLVAGDGARGGCRLVAVRSWQWQAPASAGLCSRPGVEAETVRNKFRALVEEGAESEDEADAAAISSEDRQAVASCGAGRRGGGGTSPVCAGWPWFAAHCWTDLAPWPGGWCSRDHKMRKLAGRADARGQGG